MSPATPLPFECIEGRIIIVPIFSGNGGGGVRDKTIIVTDSRDRGYIGDGTGTPWVLGVSVGLEGSLIFLITNLIRIFPPNMTDVIISMILIFVISHYL